MTLTIRVPGTARVLLAINFPGVKQSTAIIQDYAERLGVSPHAIDWSVCRA
jgi:hypothetical protein